MNFKRYHVSKNLVSLSELLNAPSGKIYTIGQTPYTADHLITLYLTPNTDYTLSSDYVKSGTKSNIVYFMYADSMYSVNSENPVVINSGATGKIDIAMFEGREGSNEFDNQSVYLMLNTGSTALPYEPYGDTWHDSHYIRGTATDTLTTLPADIYADGSNATLTLKGNMEQTGTPTSQSPIQPQECGERTANIYDNNNPVIFYGYYNSNTNQFAGNANNGFISVPIESGKTYYISNVKRVSASASVRWCTSSSLPSSGGAVLRTGTFSQTDTLTITAESGENYFALFVCGDSDYSTYGSVPTAISTNCSDLVINRGYKIPISNNSQTYNKYLGEEQTVRQIKKMVLDGTESWTLYGSGTNRFFYIYLTDYVTQVSSLPCTHGFSVIAITGSNPVLRIYDRNSIYPTEEDFTDFLAGQYAAGTPVTVWYVLSTATTGIVNEPLRKIGDYADTLSTSIPTTDGANVIDVGTTLKPSELSANYHGWHSVASVHEKSKNLFDKDNFTFGTGTVIVYVPLYVGNGEFTLSTDFPDFETKDVFFLAGNVSSGASSATNGVDEYTSRTVTAIDGYVTIATRYNDIRDNPSNYNYMLNEGLTILPYEPYWK